MVGNTLQSLSLGWAKNLRRLKYLSLRSVDLNMSLLFTKYKRGVACYCWSSITDFCEIKLLNRDCGGRAHFCGSCCTSQTIRWRLSCYLIGCTPNGHSKCHQNAE